MLTRRHSTVAMALLVAAPALGQERPPVAVPLVERMPNLPRPFQILDWKAKARGFDRLVFDEHRTGPHLPVVRMILAPQVAPAPGFALPAHLGEDEAWGSAPWPP